MEEVQSLQDLFAYNTWGNSLVFAACRGLDQVQLQNEAPGTMGTIEMTLTQLVSVEEVYIRMLRDEPLPDDREREEYVAHDIAWFEQRARQLGEEYQTLLAAAEPTFYDAELKVPWFDFRLTKHDGLLQVLSHSAQHRAQVFSVLGQRGLEVPSLDYVMFVKERGDGGEEESGRHGDTERERGRRVK